MRRLREPRARHDKRITSPRQAVFVHTSTGSTRATGRSKDPSTGQVGGPTRSKDPSTGSAGDTARSKHPSTGFATDTARRWAETSRGSVGSPRWYRGIPRCFAVLDRFPGERVRFRVESGALPVPTKDFSEYRVLPRYQRGYHREIESSPGTNGVANEKSSDPPVPTGRPARPATWYRHADHGKNFAG